MRYDASQEPLGAGDCVNCGTPGSPHAVCPSMESSSCEPYTAEQLIADLAEALRDLADQYRDEIENVYGDPMQCEAYAHARKLLDAYS